MCWTAKLDQRKHATGHVPDLRRAPVTRAPASIDVQLLMMIADHSLKVRLFGVLLLGLYAAGAVMENRPWMVSEEALEIERELIQYKRSK